MEDHDEIRSRRNSRRERGMSMGKSTSIVSGPRRPNESNTNHGDPVPPADERYRKRLKSENTMVNRTLRTRHVTMGM